MPYIVYKKDCSDLSSLLSVIEYEFAILEKPDDIQFVSKDKVSALGNLLDWDNGRLFGRDGELRWVTRKSTFHVVIISDNRTLPQGFIGEEIKPGSERMIYLWGENVVKNRKVSDEWYELRVPRMISYPFTPTKLGSRLKLVIKEYTLADRSTIHRYCGLKEE